MAIQKKNVRPHLVLGAYLSGAATNGDAWRQPDNDVDADINFTRYAHYVEVLEEGKFDSVFLYDSVLPVSDTKTLEYSANFPRWDTFTLLAGLAVVSRHIGLIGTASTTFNEPYNIARKVLSLHHLSGGRAGWNVVTATGGGENFNLPEHMKHADRYSRANEFYDVVAGLWRTVQSGAIVRDKKSGRWADPSRITPLNHKGTYFSVQGPLNVPPPEQRLGTPVIAQAGSSEDGRDLAARIGEVIFTAEYDLQEAIRFRQDLFARAQRYGRGEAPLRILPGLAPIVGRTTEEAQEKLERYLSYLDRPETLNAFANYASLGLDLASWPSTQPIILPEVLAQTNTHKSRQNLIARWIRERAPTPDDILRFFNRGGHRLLAGSARDIADHIQEWFEAGAVDGFNIMFTSAPAGIEDFVRLVVPELQKRGLFKKDYTGFGLRENLGLPNSINI
ncbi:MULTISPECIES: NtaA/DmoA family FMN-dependent monooxygenase [Acetobacter]|uniref:NtaA/DmoA family FMN-dependent monooxygenase n=1 Tax=Acetobacter TaxID=434 RepID=UPI00376FAF32